jgi:hypothetical protein
MLELLALVMVVFGGILLLGVVVAVLKLAFWLILLPFRLLFGLLFLPFLVVGFLLKLLFGVLLLPVLGVLAVVAIGGALVAGLLAIVVPLLPVVLAGLAVFALAKYLNRPATVPPA